MSTLGPSSHTIEAIEQLIHAGANVFRLNFSHGDFEEHGHRIQQIRRIEEKSGKRYPIILDTNGPDIRTEDVEEKISVEKGDTFTGMRRDKIIWSVGGGKGGIGKSIATVNIGCVHDVPTNDCAAK